MLFHEIILGWFKPSGDGPTPFQTLGIIARTNFSKPTAKTVSHRPVAKTAEVRPVARTNYRKHV